MEKVSVIFGDKSSEKAIIDGGSAGSRSSAPQVSEGVGLIIKCL